MTNDIVALIEQAIGERVFPGCVVGIVYGSGERTVLPFGKLTYDQGASKVSEATQYDLASITKSIPTASLALKLFEEGRLRPSDRVVQYLPELHNDYEATVEDLLRYRVHGTRLSALKDKAPQEILEHVFESGFEGPPGEAYYTNLPALILGLIVERIEANSLEHMAHEYFFGPLGMHHTSFFPQRLTNVAPTEMDEWRGVAHGLPHDESAYAFARERRVAAAGRARERQDDTHPGHGEALGTAEPVKSPTFVLMNEYHGRLTVYHADLYRLNEPSEVVDLALDDVASDGVLVVEWPDRAPREMPPEHLLIQFEEAAADERAITLTARGNRYAEMLAELVTSQQGGSS